MACKYCSGPVERGGNLMCRACSIKNRTCMRCGNEPHYTGHGSSYYGEKCFRELFGKCGKCGATWCRHREFGS